MLGVILFLIYYVFLVRTVIPRFGCGSVLYVEGKAKAGVKHHGVSSAMEATLTPDTNLTRGSGEERLHLQLQSVELIEKRRFLPVEIPVL